MGHHECGDSADPFNGRRKTSPERSPENLLDYAVLLKQFTRKYLEGHTEAASTCIFV